MTLRDYIKSGKLDAATLAYTIGVSEHAVHKWIYGQRRPDLETALKVVRATNGAVALPELIGAEAVETIHQAISQGALTAPKVKRARGVAA